MKFTKFALASAAAFGLAGAASATDYVGDGLDKWEHLDKAPMTGYGEDGTVSGSGVDAVWYGGKDGDETKVMAYADEGAPAAYSGKHPSTNEVEMAAGDYYLKVSNSDPLWRMLNKYDQDPQTGDWPASFPTEGAVVVPDAAVDEQTQELLPYNGGLFVDTLVQFTPSEEAPTVEYGDGSKLIVWMNSESNLCVTAGKISYNGAYVNTTTDFTTTTPLKTGVWYRLTVSAFNDVALAAFSSCTMHGFVVRIDGTEVVAKADTVDATALAMPAFDPDDDDYFACYPEVLTLIKAKKFFCSIDCESTVATLAAVGFKGEGLVDDIVVTDVEPTFGPAPVGGIDFTLTWGEGVSAVWYAIDGVESEATNGEEIELEDGEEFAITRATPEAWYTIDPASTNAAPVDGETYTVSATAAATAGAAGVTDEALANWTVAQVKAAFGDTVTPAAIEAADAPYLDYQFGQDLGTLSAAPDVKITDIAENATEGWDITVKMFKGTDALDIETGTGSEGSKTIKAALKVKQAATLAGLASAEPATYDLTFDDDKTDITVTVTAGSFFKAYVEFAAAPSVE